MAGSAPLVRPPGMVVAVPFAVGAGSVLSAAYAEVSARPPGHVFAVSSILESGSAPLVRPPGNVVAVSFDETCIVAPGSAPLVVLLEMFVQFLPPLGRVSCLWRPMLWSLCGLLGVFR